MAVRLHHAETHGAQVMAMEVMDFINGEFCQAETFEPGATK